MIDLLDDLQDVCAVLASARVDLTNEKATQADLHALLTARLPDAIEVVREARLSPRDVPDFIIGGGIVVEVKIKRATLRETLAQITRYAEHHTVTAVIVVSNRAMSLPVSIHGKPVVFVSLGRAWL